MLDIRSTLRKVNSEQRKYPRLELQCKAVVRGYNGIFTITDISLGGLFIERQGALIVKIGQVTDISIKLPEQDKSIQVKAKFISQNKRGIGCAFIALSPENKEVINKCIEEFNDALGRAIREPGPHLIDAIVPSEYEGLKLKILPHLLGAMNKIPSPIAKALKKKIAP